MAEINKNDKQAWDRFVLEQGGSFLQSWEWGQFQENFGRKTFRFVGEKFVTQFIEMPLPFGKKYWYCPKGPVLKPQIPTPNDQNLEEFIKIINEAAKSNGVMFWRVGPAWGINKGFEEKLKKENFQQLSYDIEPSQTLILDITKNEDELLAQMHEKWRYNIRLAERKGVIIKKFQTPIPNDQFERFYELVEKGTSERKNIKHHPKDYYKKQLAINGEEIKFNLFVAEYENKVVAANIVVFFGKTATYLHGATNQERREVMAPHLLQWEQIKDAKAQGCQQYDFWGIVNEHTKDKRGQSWEGFTRFKRGFGGQEVNYVGYFDYPLDKCWYSLYRLVQKVRR